MEKKYQVFISSTFIDLVTARQKVIDTILALHQIPAGMEMFPAGDDDQWTHIKSEIDKSDYYLLILGHRYGSLAPDGFSYTEKEYDYAREQGIPVLAFIMNRNVPVDPSLLDDVANARKKLEKFIQKAKTSKLCKFWSTPDELATMVSTSLSHAFATHPRLGWIRGDQAVSPEFTEELVALSKENRKLKEELESYKELNTQHPLIKLGLNVGQPITLEHKKMEHQLLIAPSEIDISTVPSYLCEFIDPKSIDEYNATISDDIEKVEQFNKRLKLHNMIQAMGLELQLKIANDGSGKANNIYVDIEFPDSVLIVDGEKEDFPMPAYPALTPNPIKKAESAYDAVKNKTVSNPQFKSLFGMSNLVNWAARTPFADISSKQLKRATETSFYTRLNENSITMICKELLHTRMRSNDDTYILIPLKPGEYEVKVSIICEQYTKADKYTIPLIINY